MNYKLLICLCATLLALPAGAQQLEAHHPDVAKPFRLKRGQYAEVVVLTKGRFAEQPLRLRGEIGLMDPKGFLLRTGEKQWTDIRLAKLVSIRRIAKREFNDAGLQSGQTDLWGPYTGALTWGAGSMRRISPASAAMGAGIGSILALVENGYTKKQPTKEEGWTFQVVSL